MTPVSVVALVRGVGGPPGSDDGDVFIVTPVGASSLETFIGWTNMWTAWWLGVNRWWSGASSYTSMAADLGGVAQWRLGVRWVAMDSRSRTTLSGIVVASMAERPGMVDASVSDLRMDRWMKEVTVLAVCACGAH